MRQFIRHPADIPIEIMAHEGLATETQRIHNVGCGGLAIGCAHEIAAGTVIRVRITLVNPAFESSARVIWCRRGNGACELGLEFLDADDAYRARMVQQVCHIESYRQHLLDSEGRRLNADEAAAEWIGRFAAGFPDPDRDEESH